MVYDILSEYLLSTYLDIDECSSGTASCMENSVCVNQDGSYACVCDTGYDYVDGKCTGKNSYIISVVSILYTF